MAESAAKPAIKTVGIAVVKISILVGNGVIIPQLREHKETPQTEYNTAETGAITTEAGKLTTVFTREQFQSSTNIRPYKGGKSSNAYELVSIKKTMADCGLI